MFKPKDNNTCKLKQQIEAALFVSPTPLPLDKLQYILNVELSAEQAISKQAIDHCISELIVDYQTRGIELIEVASGFRFQSHVEFSPLLKKLFSEKAPKYSRALLETLALIAYKQPITRGEIEGIRGVAVSSHIMKTLLEHGWVKVLAQKEVPGRPSLYGTTKTFLDYFSLKSLSQLPNLENKLANKLATSDHQL